MYNALTIGVYGMIESKRIERKVKKQETKIHSHDAFNEPTLGM